LYNGDQSKEEMVINLKWGAFGENNELEDFYTKYDKQCLSNMLMKILKIVDTNF